MSYKVLATADWHLGTFRSPVKDGVNLRTEDTKRCLDELIMVAREEQPDYSLISGDIFHVGHLWSDRCCEEIVTAVYYIRELAAVSRQVIVMRGTPNHDGKGQFHVLQEMFADYQNVHIVTEPQVLSFDNADIAVLPGFDRGVFRAKFPGISSEEENEVFTKELGNIVLGLKAQCSPNKKSILMAHYTVPGCNTESGQAMMLTKFEPILPAECLLAADFDLVALGHIHRPQEVPNIKKCFYSGAVNAMNFNDEGQERGFWIHHFHHAENAGAYLHTSEFFRTPYREFITIHLADADVTAINLGNYDEVALKYWRYDGKLSGKIVRILYSCSYENKKALKAKEAVLERELLEDGAFMVWEILPEKTEELVNRTELAATTDPEKNLRKYLEEKQYSEEKIQELILKARPIISEAEVGRTIAGNTGVFEPVEITVKNYRNYEEETFNFEDITFCTINGQNGAGKSSLFMDAIIDCLFEKTRENFVKDETGRSPWIRNDEKVHSGAIMFTFRIGEKKYRVTRTRNCSGKGTLNIAQFIDGEWKDCSKERYNDTQQEVLNILGMDSFTFKSCALIMQDQYGLFLQAKPEERVEVLSTLLGLGIYQTMENIAKEKKTIFSTKMNELKQRVKMHNNTIAGFGNSEEELAVCQKELFHYESRLQFKTAERDRNKKLLTLQQAAVERQKEFLAAVTDLQRKKTVIVQNKVTQQAIIDSSSIILNNKSEIEKKVAEYNAKMEREKQLAGESALYSSKKAETESLRQQEEAEQKSIDSVRNQILQKETELTALQSTDQDAVIQKNVAEYEKQKKLLEEAYEKERSYRNIEQKLTQAKYTLQQISMNYKADIENMQLRENGYKKKAELLSTVECVDISNANCGFLADAISAKQILEVYPERYTEREKIYKEKTAPLNAEIVELEKELEGMNFDKNMIQKVSKKITELKPFVAQLEILNQREARITLIKANLEHLQSNILEAEKRLSMVKLRADEAEKEREQYEKSFEEHAFIQNTIQTLKPWLEKEKQLPVAEERKATAMARILELEAELADIDSEISKKQAEADQENSFINGIEEIENIVVDMNKEIDSINDMMKKKQIEFGALKQKLEQIKRLKKEIVILQEQQTQAATETANYELLKTAFSQSGVPHQIIRSVIPQLTETSNAILGQMTGGKMGTEFRLERMQKKEKEKGTLDIFIEEYGKAALPYLSKSGGEKVKASLSVILALAEMKSSAAGIQLGMLFIDEPPFLDGEGIQAYCDSLETIQNRYRNIKIMAITHDPTMKARFPQNLDIVKTEHGSKVIY